MRDLRDDERKDRDRGTDRDEETGERVRRGDGRDRRATDWPRDGRRAEERGEPDLDERERQVRTSRVAERPFG